MARWRYDEGLRPTHQYVEVSGSEALVMRTVYGESLANAEVLNLRGQAYRVYDGAGVQTAVAYDFKGGLLAAERQLAVDVTATLDWSALGELEDVSDLENAAATMLETEVFRTESTFDALGRARTQTTPDGTVVRLAYNEAALLESVSANVRGSASETAFVSNVDYDAQGRRSLIAYGNGTETTYAYDDVTQRLTRMRTQRADDSGRMCDVETRTVEGGSAVATPTTHHRYQYSNHLGSASLELTGSAEVISYEEYHPYGTSSYRAVNSSIDVSERTYRYTGKERDEETGLGYHGARYYACWLGRWTASDPIGLGDGVNRYAYVSGNPISLSDPSGTNGSEYSAGKPLDADLEREKAGFVNIATSDADPATKQAAVEAVEILRELQGIETPKRATQLPARLKSKGPRVEDIDFTERRDATAATSAKGAGAVLGIGAFLGAVAAGVAAGGVGYGYVVLTGEAELAAEVVASSPLLTAAALSVEVVGEAEALAGGEPPGTHLPARPRRPKSASGVIDVPRQGPGDFAGEARAAVAKNKPKVRVGAAVEASAAGGEGEPSQINRLSFCRMSLPKRLPSASSRGQGLAR